MHAYEEFLWSNNYITRYIPLVITLDSPALRKIPIAQNFPTNINYIIGLDVEIVGVGPNGEAPISITDAENLFITLFIGNNQYFEDFRLSKLIFNPTAGSADQRDRRFWPSKFPGNTDMTISEIGNPTGITSGTIVLGLLYV